jgi:hypothetical protein
MHCFLESHRLPSGGIQNEVTQTGNSRTIRHLSTNYVDYAAVGMIFMKHPACLLCIS